MTACCAFGCSNRFSNKIPGVTFHRFPENPEQRDAWVLAIRRKNWRPSRNTRLCSEHFSEDQMNRTSNYRVRLRDNAVPNVFNKTTPLKNRRGEHKKAQKVLDIEEKSTTEYCKIAVRPTKTAPLVISVKPVSTAESSSSNNESLPAINTMAPSHCVSSSSTATITTAVPLNIFTQVPQILTTSGTPIITSPLSSILTTPVGQFLTTGLPQTLTLPISQNLAAPVVTNPSQQEFPTDTAVSIKQENGVMLQPVLTIPARETGEVLRLKKKNEEYLKKIKSLQQTVRQQKKLIEQLSCVVKIEKDDDDVITEFGISEESEEDIVMHDLLERQYETEMRTNSPEEILP